MRPRGSAPGATRATAIPSGSGAAVVRIACPAGSSATRARLRAGSSSEKTSSSSRVGTRAVRARISSCTPRRRARARQRCSPWEAWVRASRPSIARTRSSRCGPTVLTPRRRSSRRLAARAARRSPSQLRPYRWRTSGRVLPRRRGGCRPHATRGSRSATSRSRAATSTLPASASRWSHTSRVAVHVRTGPPARLAQQRGALAQDPLGLVGRPRALGVEQRQRVVEQVAPPLGAAADEREVLGREDRARSGGPEVPPRGHALRLTLVRLDAPGANLRLDQRRAVGTIDLRPHDGAARARPHQRLGRRTPEGPARAEIRHGLEHARLPRAVRTRDDRGSLGLGVDQRVREDAEVDQLQPAEAHRGARPLRRPAPA